MMQDSLCDRCGTQHCKKKNLLNCLQLTCRKSKEASAVTPTSSQIDSTNFDPKRTCGVWMEAWLEHAACQLLAVDQVFFAVQGHLARDFPTKKGKGRKTTQSHTIDQICQPTDGIAKLEGGKKEKKAFSPGLFPWHLRMQVLSHQFLNLLVTSGMLLAATCVDLLSSFQYEEFRSQFYLKNKSYISFSHLSFLEIIFEFQDTLKDHKENDLHPFLNPSPINPDNPNHRSFKKPKQLSQTIKICSAAWLSTKLTVEFMYFRGKAEKKMKPWFGLEDQKNFLCKPILLFSSSEDEPPPLPLSTKPVFKSAKATVSSFFLCVFLNDIEEAPLPTASILLTDHSTIVSTASQHALHSKTYFFTWLFLKNRAFLSWWRGISAEIRTNVSSPKYPAQDITRGQFPEIGVECHNSCFSWKAAGIINKWLYCIPVLSQLVSSLYPFHILAISTPYLHISYLNISQANIIFFLNHYTSRLDQTTQKSQNTTFKILIVQFIEKPRIFEKFQSEMIKLMGNSFLASLNCTSSKLFSMKFFLGEEYEPIKFDYTVSFYIRNTRLISEITNGMNIINNYSSISSPPFTTQVKKYFAPAAQKPNSVPPLPFLGGRELYTPGNEL
ncbi:hypothetical protein VP01_3011g1 [Puccinia sorghi]|uniref:Uncharacterized protein n=1 Tax=Puccinia sorghi TaxID=27349 RepID=A0A0L6V108_9BASI|nr:hypothetical protein VP01_3011g1 [Puccinia sorghi]